LTRSEQFLELNELLKRILFIGGGYIAFEFPHVAARAGSQVTIVHRGARPLELFDPDLVDQMLKLTRELGVRRSALGTEAQGIEKESGQLAVVVNTSGQKRKFLTDLVVHVEGRIPEIDDLDLRRRG